MPEDLGIKIGTKEEAAWTDIRDKVILAIDQGKREMIINETILNLANQRIAMEHKEKKDLNS